MMTRVSGVVAVGFLLALSSVAYAQKTDCSGAIVKLASCLNFVSGKQPTPPDECCDALGPMVKNTPECLCRLIGYGSDDSGTAPPSALNATLAKALPTLCSVTVHEERCPGLVGEVGPPAAGGPAPPPTLGSEGPAPPPSAAATLFLSLPSLFACVVVAFAASSMF